MTPDVWLSKRPFQGPYANTGWRDPRARHHEDAVSTFLGEEGAENCVQPLACLSVDLSEMNTVSGVVAVHVGTGPLPI